ncbi:translocation/assembly module TamB domain-containing protein [Mucilaginibacter sp.]
MKRFGLIALKTILWLIASVLFLVLLVAILIQVPAVQNFAKNNAVNFLQGKIHTKVRIDHISIGLPKSIVLEGVYFEDQKRDTLIAGDKLEVDISMLKLLHHTVEINEINLDGITAKVSRGPDSVFNFDYIMRAFASQQKVAPKPTDTTSAMKFSVETVIFNKINIAYKDAITGYNVKFLLGHFDTKITTFDLDKMKFTIPKVNLSGFNAKIIQTTVPPPKNGPPVVPITTKHPQGLTLNVGTVDISKINVDYGDPTMTAKVNLGRLLIAMKKIDLNNQVIGIKSIDLDDTKAILTFAQPQSVKKEVVKVIKKLDTLAKPAASTKGWAATLDRITFSNDDVKYDNNAIKAIPKGLDFGHMDIHNLNADIENLSYNPDTMSGKINSFTSSEKSGLELKKFHTAFFYGPKNAYLNDLYLETPQTVIQKQIQVSYPSIASLSTNLGALSVNANLDGSRVSLKDVLILMPTMSTSIGKVSPTEVFRINGRVFGKVNDLHIPSLEITGLRNTHIKASANMRGLPNVNKATFDVNIANFTTSSADINTLASKGMIPTNVSVPENINLKGTFKGGISNFKTKMSLRTSDGAVDLTAAMKNGSNKNNASYSANIRANDLNVGALTKQPQTVGSITLSANISGTGLNPKTASLKFNGNVAKAYVKGYTYQNLKLNGTAQNGAYAAKVYMADPNIHFNLDAKANMNKKYPSIYATLDVDSIDMQKLHFSTTAMRFHGKIVAKVPTADPNYLNANIQATDLLIVNGTQRIKLDTVSLISTANSDSSTLKLKLPMLTAHMAGKYKLPEVGPAMQDLINKYYNTSMASGKHVVKYSPESFEFDIHVVKTPLAAQFAPDLKQLDPILIKGNFDSQAGTLVVNGAMPKVVYGTNTINNLKLNINTANNAFNYAITADNVKAGSSLNLLYTSISGNAQNNKLNLSLQVRDATKKERYRIAGVFSALPNEYQFSFLQNGLLLNYTEWAVASDNSLEFGTKGIMAKDFVISNSGQSLGVTSNPQTFNAPLTVDFKNFHIETLTRLAQQDSLQVGGVINGDAHISNFQKSPVFTAALNVGDFNFKGDTVGNIALKVNNQTANAYSADVDITGKGNQVTLKGIYYTQPNSRFDLDLNIVTLNMKSVEGFSFGAIRRATGNITGNMKITGTTSAPAVRGDINFNKVGFNVSMLNSYFSMPNESITFNNDGIRFNDFTLIDSTGNKAVVTGSIYTTNYTDFKFGMKIHMDNFRVINSTQADNKLYYGKLYLNSDVSINGNMDKPIIDANLTVNNKTDLTIVLPADDPGVEDRKGVVEVINENAPKLDSILLARKLDSLKQSNLKGLDVNATVNISKAAKFTIVVDPGNGDVVHIQGEGHLNGGIDPSGKTSLTGIYTVEAGSYNLAYATVKRKFLFKKGSTITWTGDPTSANINLTAVYVANVPPIDLVQQQLGGDNTSVNATQYKQKLPFNVNLNMKNQLLKPDISFDIILPDSSYEVSPTVVQTVNDRLAQVRQDPNEMNKQVLGVLVLGHFIGDNPLQSQAGSTGINGAIRNSVSSLLSDQLNKLAGNLIGGVQLSFNLSSGADYSTGIQQNRTDLNVGLSKKFLNDRVTVTVGNNFNLEGQNQPGQKTTDIAGNLSVNYKLTEDGRYMVRAYRKDEFIVIEGQVVETGVGFSITYEYNKFKELFVKKSKEDKAREKKYKQDQKEKKKEQKQAEKNHDDAVTNTQPVDQPAQNKQTSN